MCFLTFIVSYIVEICWNPVNYCSVSLGVDRFHVLTTSFKRHNGLHWTTVFPRRVEDKLDAKGLVSEMVSLRYEVAPSTKRVKLTYPGWMIFPSGAAQSNIWYECQMMSDRTRVIKLKKNRLNRYCNIYFSNLPSIQSISTNYVSCVCSKFVTHVSIIANL